MDQAVSKPIFLSIAAVERDTGLSKDTLRVWERRYGFPAPQRDQYGERIYPLEQVDRLRAIRRLMDAGHRPGKIIGLSDAELAALADRLPTSQPTQLSPQAADLEQFMQLIRAHQVEDLRRGLSQRVLRMGLARFVTDVVAPLTDMVGDAWARGQLEVFEEHLYTESLQVVLRSAISTIPQPGHQPRVLLTTFPTEAHGMGLLMVEALLALEGCRCFSLGVQTPVFDISLAVESQAVDIVVLSFSSIMNPNVMAEGLAELRAKLPASVEIWAGGHCPSLRRRAPNGVVVLTELEELSDAVHDWRKRRGAAPGQH
jgi:DNA-binding transcriptional MerR regulator/methylmalonyl-CoA mutase cobalamin-binding subunit